MARDLFMLVLAVLTLVAGGALAIMILRRRREAQSAARRSRRNPYGTGRARPRRRVIDDYAKPAGFDATLKKRAELDEDAGKICPRCGARYGSHHRFCEHDNSELAALN